MSLWDKIEKHGGMVELADASGLSPDGRSPCGFESHFRHQKAGTMKGRERA